MPDGRPVRDATLKRGAVISVRTSGFNPKSEAAARVGAAASACRLYLPRQTDGGAKRSRSPVAPDYVQA